MSLKKQYLKSKPICKVTFRLPQSAVKGAKKVHLVGEFNNWDHKSTPLKKLPDGSFSIALSLLDGKTWENDWEADGYVHTEIPGVENSIVKL
jgi:1,4-alpha-glucan branching enzyme